MPAMKRDTQIWDKPDPQVAQVLKALPEMQNLLSGSYEDLSGRFKNFKALAAGMKLDESGVDTKELVMKVDGSVDVPARLYTPTSQRGKLPTLIVYHGGGFCVGDLESEHIVCVKLCQIHKCLVVNVDYRL